MTVEPLPRYHIFENFNKLLGKYRLTDELYRGERTIVYRAVPEEWGKEFPSVVLKLLHQEYPTFNDLLLFRNQYTIAKNLNISGIVRPFCLEPYRKGYILVMEDFGGISLRNYTKNKILSVIEVLEIAQQIAVILYEIHLNRVIHKDIKAANILINTNTKEVKIIDFGIASLLPKETQEIKNPNSLEGTLAYLAPEQTGRMNRGIDYRADFYALGVTLFELLTGKLPFDSQDPMELLHCHLAQQPPNIHSINPQVPAVVAAIVTKLMAKNAEDRYQSALGLKYDLEICLNQLKLTGKIVNFPIAQRDTSDRFIIPEKLYGREKEVNTLLEAFVRVASPKDDRVANGTAEMMLVAGFSGIGKTALVHEVHKPITSQKGYFIKGKFDQFNRNIPFSAFVQALRDLMGQLLSESDAQLAAWRTKLLEAVGENGQVLIEVIPELEIIIGKQSPAQELSGTAAQNRFNLLFQKFIQVFTAKEHPLVMFLDDLQWADLASLQLIKLLIEDKNYLLLLGAYRDNEVSPVHPFILTVEELKKAGKTVNKITLTPLAFEDTNQLVADSLLCSTEPSRPLSELIDRKTKGNPFFTTQFLKALYEDRQIKFNREQGYWECDMAQINALSLTDDVVEFMAQQLQKLPNETQQILNLAACIGNQFDLNTLSIVSEKSPADAAMALWKALQEGMILPQSEVYKFYISHDETDAKIDNIENVAYRFLHDRVQQAAYSLIEPAQKQATHLKIGTLLLEKLSFTQREERIFEIVNHLNIGNTLITQITRKEELARLNLLAGTKAKASTAYSGALTYIKAGMELLPPNCWERYYELTFALFKERAEVEYLKGNFEQAEIWLQQTVENAKTPLEKAEVYNISIVQYTLQAKYPEAIQAGRQALALIDIDLPEKNLDRVRDAELALAEETLKNRSFSELVDLPIMAEPEKKMAIKLLISMGPPTYRSHQRLWSVICAKAINLCLQYGNTPEIGYIYPAFGGLRGYAFDNYQGTDELLDVTLKLMQGFNNKSAESVGYLMIGSSLRHWSHPLKVASEDYLCSYQVGLESSNLQYAAYAFGHNMYCRFYQSVRLQELCDEIATSLAFSQKYKNQWAIDLFIGGQRIVSELMGTSVEWNESEYLEQCRQHKNWQVICIYNILKSQVLFFYGRLEEAFHYGEQAEREIINVAPQGLLPYAHHCFIYALLLLARYPEISEKQRLEYWHKISNFQKKLEIWSQNSPTNFLHLCDLVKAEMARISGNFLEAITNYDRAISGAKANEYIQEEALANELAAKFYLAWSKEKVAAGYMQEAYYCYARWGAKAKTDDLEKRYPELLQPILQQQKHHLNPLATLAKVSGISLHTVTSSYNSGSTSISDALDFTSVLKAAQAISSSIKLDELLKQLTQIILQNSGADRCILLFPTENQWQVRAITTPDTTELRSESIDNYPHLPIALIQYVKNTRKMVVIDELKTDFPLIDNYLLQHQPKSALCLPVLNQGDLVGILYLQNQATTGVFTSDRILVLNFLCTQAAISLQNAQLYQQAQQALTDLKQAQLQIVQSEKMSALGNLVAGVAHEINNPVGFISGNLTEAKTCLQDLIEHFNLYRDKFTPTPEIKDHAEQIDLQYVVSDLPKMLSSMQLGCDRIKNISTSLRTFSRADKDYQVYFNIHEGIDSTIMILKHRLKGNDKRPQIQIIKEYDEIPIIEGFPGQLNQVFMNILANAIDMFDDMGENYSFEYFTNNPQRIRIKTEVLKKSNQVVINIKDNGLGMEEHVKQRIFEHLFTTKAVGKGTGLGLTIARQIVEEKHGGSIHCSSRPGEGTEFIIQLPITK
ncbi:AAA family ATPase [Aerosakkonema funiforme]|uniref:ATP-binding sensor histidine kinase n=1 Tax=Aerosakkonema funiforme TaxID=1246630 RepID=UPI0035B84870